MNLQMLFQLMQQIQNPQQFLQNMIPQEHMTSPGDAARFLMQSGKVNQTQVNQAYSMYQQFKNRGN